MKLRRSNLEKLESRIFDVLIVGGGINGAVSAAALAAQGASVALVEREDFASFTSQESSNLIWGGVKYLESGELSLVIKLCRSRNTLLRSFPSSIREARFFATVERGLGFMRHPVVLFLGALLYWAIGRFYTHRPRLLSLAAIARDEPAVAVLGGGVEYSEGHLIDTDARFVLKFVRAALDHGAVAVNYSESLGSARDASDAWVTRVRDVQDGRERSVRSRVLLNATGPFADERNTRDGISTRHRHVFSKGVHLIVPRISSSDRVLTFFADDGRLFFVIPMGTVCSIGTTDTRIEVLPPRIEDADRDFILSNVNKRLRLSRPLTRADVIAERCGARPLAVDVGGDANQEDWIALSRRHAIDVNRESKHISIFGGKLTDCLNVGEEITAEVRALGIPVPYFGRRWYGEPPASVRDEFFHQANLMRLDEMTAKESSEPLSTRLWRRYAASALTLLDYISQDARMAEVLIEGTEYIRCELYHAAQCEMVEKLADFLRRRSKIALVARPQHIRVAPGLLEACQILFGDEAQAKYDEYFGPPSRAREA